MSAYSEAEFKKLLKHSSIEAALLEPELSRSFREAIIALAFEAGRSCGMDEMKAVYGSISDA